MKKKREHSEDSGIWNEDFFPGWPELVPEYASRLAGKLERSKAIAPLSQLMRDKGSLGLPARTLVSLPVEEVQALLRLALSPSVRPTQRRSKLTAKHHEFMEFLRTVPPERRQNLHGLRSVDGYTRFMKMRAKTRRDLLQRVAAYDDFEDLTGTESGG